MTKYVVDTYSAAICSAARKHKAPCAAIYHAINGPDGTRFDGPYVADDHTHPSQRGHNTITATLSKLGFAPLV